ncbi:hypothetical protein [Campylobacter gastrosuis]|uniref:Uncharacterized protein n=1 Tax=Campylobacter gastrosuis TaxID=2974576 RepID=A0ABT7HQV6_9BACT|nr:hypothetical protein [Campylobacter gastrosuis]MDL0088808.1 hypothetical protein [Campylobacter gastrosuis]
MIALKANYKDARQNGHKLELFRTNGDFGSKIVEAVGINLRYFV